MKIIISRVEPLIQAVHHYKVTPPKDEAKEQRWFTYVPDKTKPNGRKRVAKNSKLELYSFLMDFYGITEEVENGKRTFGDIYYEWVSYKETFVKVANKKKGISPSTIKRYKRDFEKCIKGSILDRTPIEKVTSILLEKFLKEMIVKHNLSESFAKNILGYVRNVFEYAIRNRYISTNEFLFVDKALLLAFVASKPPKKDSDRVLTKKETKALYEAIRRHQQAHPYYMPDYAIELALMTGMRVGELAALRWNDIRYGALHIDFSEHRLDFDDHCELVIDEPKNLKHREFPLNDNIEELLERIKALSIDSEFIFARENGVRYTAHDISCACDRRASEAGIKKTSVHGIRRTVASEMRKIANIKIVSNLLGHLEETDEGYYNYDNSEFDEKKAITTKLCSNVLNFNPQRNNKKIAKAL